MDVQDINDNPSTREDKRQDVDYFFRTAVVKEVNGKSKKYRTCKLCLWVLMLNILSHLLTCNSSGTKSLVDEVTTLRRHLEASHAVCDDDTFFPDF